MELAWPLAGLFASAFAAATLIPMSSEAVLAAVLLHYPQAQLTAVLVATLGNTLGGATSVWCGTRLRHPPAHARGIEYLQRHGAWLLLLSWVPLLGDALCLAAGWLRLPWRLVWPLLALGKLLRYAATAYGVALWQ
jgi:membrane protein YqaA with SNARE-associated domain